ncbi:hypothetical protein ACHAWF_006785, partial [Thalassiosira exigua]
PAGTWTDLSPRTSHDADLASAEAVYDARPLDANVPKGRVGHVTDVYDGCLYVFGGLTYRLGSFHVDYGDGEEGGDTGSDALAIWKACGLDEILGEKGGEGKGKGRLTWSRIRAEVDPGTGPSDPLANEPDRDEEAEAPNEGAAEVPDDGAGAKDPPRSLRDGGGERGAAAPGFGDASVAASAGARGARTKPLANLPRGEAQGGRYSRPVPSDGDGRRETFVFHGGMHHRRTSSSSSATLVDPSATGTASGSSTTILGDVWEFDYATETLRLLCPYPPPSWQRDERNGDYPKARTAHAGTVVGHELIVHGGMSFDSEDEDDGRDSSSSSFSSPSNAYATYKTTASTWKALSDVWVFDLRTLRWKERVMFPQLARSYHSLVGWGNGTVAAFGGFQQDNNIPREKLQPPHSDTDAVHWRTSPDYAARPGISNRLEHTAVLDRFGSMYIWGGRFQTVRQIVGLWRLDIFNEDARLAYDVAPPDGIDQYEAELEALHLFIATMMFVSLTISSLFSMMRRNGAVIDNEGGGRRSIMGRRGLSRQAIDSIPLKRYEAHQTEVTEDGELVEDVSLSRENSLDENNTTGLEENLDCCAICLVPYEDGVSEVRTLPCGHVFDKECIDSWLEAHTTCPSCRCDLDDQTATSPEDSSSNVSSIFSEQMEYDPRFQFLTAFDGQSRRRHSHWTSAGDELDSQADAGGEPALGDNSDDNSDGNNRALQRGPRFLHSNWRDNDRAGDEHSPAEAGFLGIRRLFTGDRRAVPVAIPTEEELANGESIELV